MIICEIILEIASDLLSFYAKMILVLPRPTLSYPKVDIKYLQNYGTYRKIKYTGLFERQFCINDPNFSLMSGKAFVERPKECTIEEWIQKINKGVMINRS